MYICAYDGTNKSFTCKSYIICYNHTKIVDIFHILQLLYGNALRIRGML